MSASVAPFSFRLYSSLASGPSPMSWLFTSSGQRIGASTSAPVLPMNGLISLKIDWFDLLAVQGTLKRLLQHYSSTTSILQCSDVFVVQLLHPYMTTGKTITLTIWIFVSKVMSLLFNTWSRFVIAYSFFNINLFILIGG